MHRKRQARGKQNNQGSRTESPEQIGYEERITMEREERYG